MTNPLMRIARSFATRQDPMRVTEIGIREVRLTSEPRPVKVEQPRRQISEAGIDEVRLAELPHSVSIVDLAAQQIDDVFIRLPFFFDGITIAGGRFKQTRKADHASIVTRVPVEPFNAFKITAPLRITSTRWPSPDAQGNRQQHAIFDLQALWPLLLPSSRTLSDDGEAFDIEIHHKLYKFQADGVRFLLERQYTALLADDMGLGKTVQAITAARVLVRHGYLLSILIVVPKSVITSWIRHFKKWAPELRCMPIQAPPEWRARHWAALRYRSIHVAVVSYDTLRNDMDRGLVPNVDLLIADEVQNIKNPSAKRSVALAQVPTGRRWGLTGTPLENSYKEFVAILDFIDPAGYRWFAEEPIRYIMLRRRKEEVLDDLPDLVTNIEYIELNPRQQAAYERAEYEGVVELQGKPRNIANVLALITRLKQICNGVNGESAKMEWLQNYAYTAIEEGDKVLMFSQYLDTLDEAERNLSRLRPLKYVGALNELERTRRIDAFQAEHSRHQMMLLQTKAGGVGITLTAANRVVHFDSWWNPAVQSQATARAHRIGQSKTVFETTLVSANTIEERIQELLQSKRELFDRAINDLSVDGVARLLTRDEMYSLFYL